MAERELAALFAPIAFVAVSGLCACGTSARSNDGSGSGTSATGTSTGMSGSQSSSGTGAGAGSASASGTSGTASGSSGASGSGTSGASGTSASGTSTSGTSGTSTSGASGTASAGSTDASVLTYHKHINRDGFYVDGAFTKSALQGATLHLDSSFAGTLTPPSGTNGEVRASPLYVESGVGNSPTFYVADEKDNVYALDATGAQVKTVNLGTGASTEPCGVGRHQVGIRGTPAIDLASGIMVLDAATGGTALTKHTIYGLRIADLSTAWSLDVGTLTSGSTTFTPSNQNQRGAVLIVNGIAYVAYGGFIGDCGDYHGWVVGVPVSQSTTTATGAKVWMTAVGDAGIWAPGGLSSDGTMIYAATGNRPLGGGSGTGGMPGDGSFSVVRFSSGPVFSGTTNDYFYAMNDTGDEDLGGSGPLLVTPAGGGAPFVVQLGKDGSEYLLDTSKPLGGAVSPSLGSLKVMNDEITGGPGWANIGGTTYVVMVGNNNGGGMNCPNGGSGELVVTTADPSNTAKPIAMAWCQTPHGGGSPIITTSDGTNDAMVWLAGTVMSNDGTAGDNQIHAFDLTGTGAPVLAASDTFKNVRHFTTPIVVHGRLFVAGDARLYAYKP